MNLLRLQVDHLRVRRRHGPRLRARQAAVGLVVIKRRVSVVPMALPGVLVALGLQEPQSHVLQVPELVSPPGRPAHVEDVRSFSTINKGLHDRLLSMEDLSLWK